MGTDEFFEVLDGNADGKMSKNEFKEMFKLADGSMDTQRVEKIIEVMKREQFNGPFRKLWRTLDTNRNGTLDLKEFSENKDSEFTAIFFEILDVNKDSKVTKNEFKEMFKLADGSMDTERVIKITALLQKEKTEK